MTAVPTHAREILAVAALIWAVRIAVDGDVIGAALLITFAWHHGPTAPTTEPRP